MAKKRKRATRTTSERNKKQLRALGASEKDIKKYGKRVSDKEMERYYSNHDPLVQSVLKQTPAFRPPPKSFDETYTPELQAEDLAQSKALFEPYFQQQISDVMEDLNAWAANENVNYNRTLRRARASYAARNTGIGTRRANEEQEITGDYQRRKAEMGKQTERQVGSQEMQGSEFTPFYQGREGEIQGKLKSAVEEQNLWYKGQRRKRYDSDVANYYKQEGNTNWLGQPI